MPLQKLRSLRAFEEEHFGFLKTLEDYKLFREIGFHHAEGSPLTMKKVFLLGIGSIATVQRRLRGLRASGVVQQRRSRQDGRAVELLLTPKYAKLFERYGQLLG